MRLIAFMMTDPKIQSATRYAFAFIGLMLLAFLMFVLISVVPLGLNMGQQIAAVRASLYALIVFAILGGAFSIRVAMLRKNSGKLMK